MTELDWVCVPSLSLSWVPSRFLSLISKYESESEFLVRVWIPSLESDYELLVSESDILESESDFVVSVWDWDWVLESVWVPSLSLIWNPIWI